jgi:hypothetical protein
MTRGEKEMDDHMTQLILNTIPEPSVCKHFGCGKRLSPQEQLFGNRCQEHSSKKMLDVTMAMKFK